MNPFAFTEEFEEVFKAWDGTVAAPSLENRKRNRIRVYKNRFVEDYLATSHPILPGVWFGPFIAFGLYKAFTGGTGIALGLGLFALGALFFTLVEYLLHRFPFHWDGGEHRRGRLRLFLMHGYHHQFPNDKLRLVAPPLLSWPLAVLFLGLFWLAIPSVMWVAYGGLLTGYLAYDWIHYYTHHGRNPRFWIGRTLRRAHAVHHYRLFHLNMGISSPLWDLVFGTFGWSDKTVKEAIRASREVEKSQG